jgi:hypothetical protein
MSELPEYNAANTTGRTFNELLMQAMRETGAGVSRMESKFDSLKDFIANQNAAQQGVNAASGERMAKIEIRLDQALAASDKAAELTMEFTTLKTHVDGLLDELDRRAETNKWVIGLIVIAIVTLIAALLKGVISIHM